MEKLSADSMIKETGKVSTDSIRNLKQMEESGSKMSRKKGRLEARCPGKREARRQGKD